MNKIIRIFTKDIKVGFRDSMILYIIIIPIILAVGILFLAPGITDSSVKVALLETDTQEHISFFDKYAKVEVFSSQEELERRIQKNDDIIGIVYVTDHYELITEGNETEMTLEYGKLLQSLYQLDLTEEDTSATILSFEKTVPPLKTKLMNMLILMVVMLSGMIISLGIVQEKADNTINAINVTPVSQNSFIIGKSLLGGISALISIMIALLIIGYTDVNFLLILIVGVTTMILSFVIGFLQGLSSTDVIEAAAGVKMTMLPIAGSIIGYELLSPNWQWTMYWSPFYWAYKANDLILSKNNDFGTILLCVAIILVLALGIYFMALPKIRKGLS